MTIPTADIPTADVTGLPMGTGSEASDFALKSTAEGSTGSVDLRGRPVTLVFYPESDASGEGGIR